MLYTVICYLCSWFNYQMCSGTRTNVTLKQPYEGWESFSENDDWVQLSRAI